MHGVTMKKILNVLTKPDDGHERPKRVIFFLFLEFTFYLDHTWLCF